MIIIPKWNPVIQNLNSFYLVLNKMIEHFQGELGSGCVHLHSPSDEGLIFFDKDDLLNGVLKNSNGEIIGISAVADIMKASAVQNFKVDIYKIETDKIYFWANIPYAKTIHSNLSTQFTDLKKLIKNMMDEKLTGFIDIIINTDKEGGFVLFSNGELMGAFYTGAHRDPNNSKKNLELLLEETHSKGGVFNVSGIPLIPSTNGIKAKDPASLSNKYEVIEELLAILEKIIASQKKIRLDYNSMLKKKFLEKVSKYEFLDPFSGDFKYVNGKIYHVGNSETKEVIRGVVECVMELAFELNLTAILKSQLKPWVQRFEREISHFGIRL